MKLLFLLSLAMLSFNAFADKILLTGRPVVLIPAATYYTFPPTYTPTTKYHFVEIGSDERVCFLNVQPELQALDMLRITIKFEEKKYLWYCYRYNPNYFKINF